jgi:hypothetical protein
MITVFISYSHKDEDLKERVLVHLHALKRERLIGVWHDRMLRPGEHLDRAIEAELAAAKLVLLLISPDFIYSDYCTEKEMKRAFIRARKGECKVVPIILRPCHWSRIPIDNTGRKLGEFVATPRNAVPVTRWPKGEDDALTDVVGQIRDLINDKTPMRARKTSRPRKRRRLARRHIGGPPKRVNHDVYLANAIWRVFLGTWDLPPHRERTPAGPKENQRFFDLVTKEFRQKAFDGELPIWGKRNKSDLIEAVPKEFWKDHRVAYLNVIRENPANLSVERVGSLQPSKEWREFMTNRSTVDAVWPKRLARRRH